MLFGVKYTAGECTAVLRDPTECATSGRTRRTNCACNCVCSRSGNIADNTRRQIYERAVPFGAVACDLVEAGKRPCTVRFTVRFTVRDFEMATHAQHPP